MARFQSARSSSASISRTNSGVVNVSGSPRRALSCAVQAAVLVMAHFQTFG